MRRLGLIAALALALSACVAAAPSSSAGSPTPVATVDPSIQTPSPSAADRYPDGIPRELDGQPVLRGGAVLAHARATTTQQPFFVGVWLDVYTGARSCPIDTRSLPPDSWLHACQPAITPSDEAGSGKSILHATETATFRFATGLQSGPAVLRTHVHDPRASQCGPDEATCDAMIVVDDAVWAGDAATEPRPLSVDAARSAVERAVPAISPLTGAQISSFGQLADGQVLVPQEQQITGPGRNPLVLSVIVMPSIDAMQRALPKVVPGAAGALSSTAWNGGWDGSSGGKKLYEYTSRWLVVGNVAVSVGTLPTPSPADRQMLERLAAALEVAAWASP